MEITEKNYATNFYFRLLVVRFGLNGTKVYSRKN